MFTGDRSGDWLYRALHEAGFANQPTARSRRDGLALRDAWVTAAVRCAPPGNRPTPAERDSCAPWLDRELALLQRATVYLCLGGFGYAALWRRLAAAGTALPRPRPRFAHGLEVRLDDGRTVLGSYHPSQQNTFTGRLTEPMFDAVFARARTLLGG
jgi:uracil-DNA glycosylase family 4